MVLAPLLDDQVDQLRQKHYNARVVERRDVHDELTMLRIVPAAGVHGIVAGQYTVLGLGSWEPRVPGCQQELPDGGQPKLLKRAYSFSCPVLDDGGRLRAPAEFPFWEFYIVLVRYGEEHPPGLTPRLFALQAGDRLFVGPKSTGQYTLAAVGPDDNVVLVATGTGEAPHNAMIAELLTGGHRGRIVAVTCARRLRDLGYAAMHRRLQQLAPSYRYIALTTREPVNLNPDCPGYVGKCYLQDYLDSGSLERDCGFALDPARTHVFLCGNPAMIGVPQRSAEGSYAWPTPAGVIEVLTRRGFHPDERGSRGNIHFEKFW